MCHARRFADRRTALQDQELQQQIFLRPQPQRHIVDPGLMRHQAKLQSATPQFRFHMAETPPHDRPNPCQDLIDTAQLRKHIVRPKIQCEDFGSRIDRCGDSDYRNVGNSSNLANNIKS
jgi:hypothetical protein